MVVIVNCEVEFVSKNRRYRIINTNGKYYVLDIENSIWPIFIPFLFWLIPQTIYKIDYNTVEKLRNPSSGTNNLMPIMILGIGGSAVLSRILKTILDFSIKTSLIVNVVLLIVSIIIIVLARLYTRKSSDDRLNKLINLEELPTKRIKIKPKGFNQYFIPIFIYLFFLLFIVAMGFLFIETSNFTPLIAFILPLPILLICNTSTIHPDLAKTNRYQINMKEA